MSGTGYLVGAGPGDPGLITARGLDLLRTADVVIADRLGTERLLRECRSDARIIDAGKAPGRQALTQDEINETLVAEVAAGHRVVRLKGGDPFVFGRGGEEVQALHAARLPAVVVPGVTSAISAPASAGVPVTHRGVATSFTVVTGHEDPTKPGKQTDWGLLARLPGTLVILMGMGRLEGISEALVAGGRPADQPVAVVQWATTPHERLVRGTLATIASDCAAAGVSSPAVVVVGDVAGLSDIEWRPTVQPLLGRRIVVTRSRERASELRAALEELGADVLELPTIAITHTPEDAAGAVVLDNLAGDAYRNVVVTSANGVAALFERLAARGADARAIPRSTRVIAIGGATAAALAGHGIRADLVPERATGEGVLDALPRELSQETFLLVSAADARPVLHEGLAARGAAVERLPVYSSAPEPTHPDDIAKLLEAGLITATASSTITNLLALLDHSQRARLREIPVISIGPVTSATAREAGLEVAAEASEATIDALVAAVVRYAAPPP